MNHNANPGFYHWRAGFCSRDEGGRGSGVFVMLSKAAVEITSLERSPPAKAAASLLAAVG